jgi:hypothetical protein
VWRLTRAAGAIIVKGFYNGLGGQAVRAVFDASVMAVNFSRNRSRTSIYRLRKDAREYIDACEQRGKESVWNRVRRQFDKLPGSA